MVEWSKDADGLRLPRWSDWLGQETAIAPAIVAIRLSSADNEANVWLSRWVRWICQQIEGDPGVQTLSNEEPAAAAAHLAWPLAHLPDPAVAFGAIWEDAAWLRTRARFATVEQATEVIAPLRALLLVGLCTLRWTTVAGGRDCSGIASVLADGIDEARYAIPEAGVEKWSGLIGSLAACMTHAGLLSGAAFAEFLARYDGDDDALIAACVNTTANGIPAATVREVLAAVGNDPTALSERWSQWNGRIVRPDSSVFGLALQALTASVG